MIALPADVRRRLAGLRLTARRGTGDGNGHHASRARGVGDEFAQYRAYAAGDEPRAVDWRLFARSDRLFVRESERDSPLTLWILVDASASMGQADRVGAGGGGPRRIEAAAVIAAGLAELALAQGDRFGWAVLGDDGTVVPPAAGRRQRDRLHAGLGSLVAAGSAPAVALDRLAARTRRDDLLVVLSDLFDAALVDGVVRLAAAQRDVACIQLLTADERDFALAGGHVFRDPETGAEVRGDAAAMRSDFLAAFAAARAALAARVAAAGIRHTAAWLDEPIDRPLARLFA